jgi:hypothetical protein
MLTAPAPTRAATGGRAGPMGMHLGRKDACEGPGKAYADA